MADYSDEQLYTALRNADAAGDTDAARQLTQYIKQRHAGEVVQSAEDNQEGYWSHVLSKKNFDATNKQFADAFSDMGRGVLHGAAKSADNLSNLYLSANAELNKLIGLGDGTYYPTNIASHTDAPSTVEGKASEYIPEMALMLTGWGAGEGLASAGIGALPEAATASRTASLAAKALEAGSGSIAAQAVSGKDPTAGQTAQDVAISLAIPAVIRAPVAAMRSVKSLIGKPSGVVMNAAERLGVNPSLATATGSQTAYRFEQLLSNTPGGAGVMHAAKEAEFKQIDQFIDDMSEKHGATGDTTATGQAVLEGMQKFAQSFTDNSEKLYNKLWDSFPRGTRMETKNFRDMLDSINGRYRDDPELAAFLRDNKLTELQRVISEKPVDAEKADLIFQVTGLQPPKATKPADLTINSVKELRTLIGESLDKPELISRNLREADANALYGALTQDIEAAADKQGSASRSAWNRANRYWRAGRERIDNHLNPLYRKKTADDVYKALFGADGKKLTPLEPQRAVAYMKSLPEKERDLVRGEIIRRMGEPTAANQAKGGEGFSPDKFLTDWNNLSETTKNAIFNDDETRANMDALATYSETLRDLGRSRNFSNTANQMILHSMVFGAITNPTSLVATLPAVAGAKITAKLMNSPKFIEWLATASRSPNESEAGRNIARLITVYFMNPPLQDDISDYAHSFPDTP